MDYIYGKLNKIAEKVEYEGLTTETAIVDVNNEDRTIKVDVIGEGASGNVDDVLVNDVSVLVDKIAYVTVPTKLKDLGQDVTHETVTSSQKSSWDNHLTDLSNPHRVNKSQVGLGNVDNTSDANKPISTATQSALDGKQAVISDSNMLGSDLVTDTNQNHKFVTGSDINTWNANTNSITDINNKIPVQASSENQLADKAFVNSSIATNTANFIGTFANIESLLGIGVLEANSILLAGSLIKAGSIINRSSIYESDVTLSSDLTITAESFLYCGSIIKAGSTVVVNSWINHNKYDSSTTTINDITIEILTNNDYAFVMNSERDFATTTEMNQYPKYLLTNFDYGWVPNSEDNTKFDLYRYDNDSKLWNLRVSKTTKAAVTLNVAYNRYKYTIDNDGWLFEYTLNNSSFTSNQWAAINSGITSSLVAQIGTNETSISNHLLDTNNPHHVTAAQIGLGVDNVPTQNSDNVVKSSGVWSDINTLKDARGVMVTSEDIDGTSLVYSYDSTNYTASVVSDNSYENLTTVKIPKYVRNTSDNCYYKVRSIGNYAFTGCIGLTSVVIGDNVTSIGQGAFYSCAGITYIGLPESLTTISVSAFMGCSSLTQITIPASVTSIGSSQVFSGCYSLQHIYIMRNDASIIADEPWGAPSTSTITYYRPVTDTQLSKINEAVQKTGNETIAGVKTFSNEAEFSAGLKLSNSSNYTYKIIHAPQGSSGAAIGKSSGAITNYLAIVNQGVDYVFSDHGNITDAKCHPGIEVKNPDTNYYGSIRPIYDYNAKSTPSSYKLGYNLGGRTLRWNNLYMAGFISDGKNTTYGLSLPDTTSYTANRTIATIDDINSAIYTALNTPV